MIEEARGKPRGSRCVYDLAEWSIASSLLLMKIHPFESDSHAHIAGKLSGSGTTSTGVVQTNVSAPRRTYAKEVVSAQDSHQEDKEDSQMMIFIVIAVLVVVAYMRYLDGL